MYFIDPWSLEAPPLCTSICWKVLKWTSWSQKHWNLSSKEHWWTSAHMAEEQTACSSEAPLNNPTM